MSHWGFHCQLPTNYLQSNCRKQHPAVSIELGYAIQYLYFVMEVDIQDIRIVIHFGPYADIDDYFQESGRDGRDEKKCEGHALYLPWLFVWACWPKDETVQQYVRHVSKAVLI